MRFMSLRPSLARLVAGLLVAAAAGLLPAAARADEKVLAGKPTLEVKRISQAPVIDGRLDDAAWERAAKVSGGLVQQQPEDGAPSTEETEFWLAYDSQNLYFAARAHYKDVGTMRVNRVQRDRHFRDDRVSLYLDTFLDQQRAYKFTLNGYGVQGDSIRKSDNGPQAEDMSWDALYESAGQVVEDGWIVEARIPFKSFRYPEKKDGEEHRWGLQLHRSIEHRDEDAMWSPVLRSTPGFLTQMGVAYGIRGLSTSRNLEILPSFTAVNAGSLASSTGVYNAGSTEPDAGVNVKYGLSSNLTLDATFNPDFSQIEADRPQITVNQRFPIFINEQRPFFLEGQELFSLGSGVNLVHTRSIVDPRYGAKLTGKLGRTSIGVLAANDEGPGNTSDVTDPAYQRNAGFVVGRVRFDYGAESYVGALVTDREFMGSFNRVAGFDGRFKVSNTKRLSVIAVASSNLDDEGTSSRGYLAQAGFSHNGRNLDWYVNAFDYSPGFVTRMGFLRRVDVRKVDGNLSWTEYPNGLIVSWTPRVQYERAFNHAGFKTDEQIQPGINVRFARNISARFNTTFDMERFNGVDFRKRSYSTGGEANFSGKFSFGGDWNWGDSIRYVAEPYLGAGAGGRVNFTIRPSARWETGFGVNFSRFVDTRTDTEVFDVKTYRASTNYQFTDRLQLRNILEYDSFAGRLGFNALVTYRVNSGTVAYFGVDDRRQRGYNLNPNLYDSDAFERTSRSVFMKVAYLFRY